MDHCCQMGIALSPHFAGPWPKHQQGERWNSDLGVKKHCSDLNIHQHLQNAARTSCWFAGDVSVRHHCAQAAMQGAKDPSAGSKNCLAAVPCATRTSVSCLSQMTAVLPVTCENFQTGTHKGLISAKGVRSWLLDIHVLCQDVWLWEDLAKDS